VKPSIYRIGITEYAQAELGDVVFVDLPEVGRAVRKGESFSSVESVKAVSDVYAPVDGKILEVNTVLADKPQLLNESPFTDGWMVVIECASPVSDTTLLDAKSYENYLAEIAK
jgi:glycine cleavage system H protein